MVRVPRIGRVIGRVAALLAIAAALLAPALAAGGEGPVATKSGALVNYITGGKLKIGKKINILVVCSADCDVTSSLRIKGPGVKVKGTVSGQLPANVPGATYLKLRRAGLKALKAKPSKFKLVNRITAADAVTGAVDSISRTFKFKKGS